MAEETVPTIGDLVQNAQGELGVTYRRIPGFDGYAAGDDGTIWSQFNGRHGFHDKWRKLKQKSHRSQGHRYLSILKDGRYFGAWVHRLVLLAFRGPAPSEEMVCRHFPDRNPENNRPDNLQWGTQLENSDDKLVHGTDQFGERNHMAKITAADVVRIRELYAAGELDQSGVAKEFGLTRSCVGLIVRGERWAECGGPIGNYVHRKYVFNSETGRKSRLSQNK